MVVNQAAQLGNNLGYIHPDKIRFRSAFYEESKSMPHFFIGPLFFKFSIFFHRKIGPMKKCGIDLDSS